MTWPQFQRWLWDPSPNVKWWDQHPVAHAAGGLIFVALGVWLLWLLRHLNPGFAVLFVVSLGIAVTVAIPMVRDENDGRPIELALIAVSFASSLIVGILGVWLLPWPLKAWVIASVAQAVWEEFQIAAWWNPTTRRSDYPTYSAVLDFSTASLVAAMVLVAAHPFLVRIFV